eukprot:2707-Heterococcus_DN1.PRE.2
MAVDHKLKPKASSVGSSCMIVAELQLQSSAQAACFKYRGMQCSSFTMHRCIAASRKEQEQLADH